MVQEPKRIDFAISTALTAGQQTSARFGPGTGTILRRLVNYHNIWFGFTAEVENADANAQGNWVLWMKPDVTQTDTAWTDANINTSDFNQMVIACGVWGASNETTYTFSSNLNSSRNMVANQELVMTVVVTGITAGQCTVKTSLCAGLSVK